MPVKLVSGKNLNKGNDFSLGDFGLGWYVFFNPFEICF